MSRTLSLDVLDNLRVASPCPMKWEQMEPINDAGDRIRHCAQCDLNVYNIANLSREEALDLVMSHAARGTRLCAQLYRRADGTLITRDCPIGLASIRRVTVAAASRLAAATLLGASLTLAAIARTSGHFHPSAKGLEPLHCSAEWMKRTAKNLWGVPAGGIRLGGAIALPDPPPNIPDGWPSLIKYMDQRECD